MTLDDFKKKARRYVGRDVSRLSSSACTYLISKLKEYDESVETFWVFMKKRKDPTKMMLDNVIMSDVIWEEFIQFRHNRKDTTRIHAGLELDTFNATMSSAMNPLTEYKRLEHKVGPLLMYLMGKYLGMVDADEYLSKAIQQIREEPHYIEAYSKVPILAEYLPVKNKKEL